MPTNSELDTLAKTRVLAVNLLRRTTIGLCIGFLAFVLGATEGYPAAPFRAQSDDGPVIRGKDDWLFVGYERVLPELAKETAATLSLIARFNRALAYNQIALVVVIVPSKMETYAQYLPDGTKVSPYMASFNDNVHNALRQNGAYSIDLKDVFKTSALRESNKLLFLRLDTHWTPAGALLAAQTIHDRIRSQPALLNALENSATAKYVLEWATTETRHRFNDIVRLLPKGSRAYPPDKVLLFKVTPTPDGSASNLLGQTTAGDIALVGSSFSGESTGFPDALRFSFQREVLNISHNADVGPWFAMREYLSNDAFQVKKPKLIIWELPERAIQQPPHYSFRMPRYRIDDNEWLLQVTALLDGNCAPAHVGHFLQTKGLMSAKAAGAHVPTTETDYVEVVFDAPVDHRAYLSARLTAGGSKQILVEANGAAAVARKFTVDVPGDGHEHALKIPISTDSNKYDKLRIYPGNTTAFQLADIKLCRYSE